MSVDVDDDSEEQRPVRHSLWTAVRRDTHWKCLILTLLIGGCLAAIAWCRLTEVTRVVVSFSSFPIASTRRSSPCDDGYVYIPMAFLAMLYLVYLVECWHCPTRLELAYRVDAHTVYERVRAMQEAPPVVWWKAVCYHYVRRSRHVTRYRNGDAYTSTQVYYERMNSHAAGTTFVFAHCGAKDISKKLVGLEGHVATKIRFSKGFAFATLDAAEEFEEQRNRFFREHERRDDYMEMREGLDLMNVHFREYMIAFTSSDRLPFYVSHLAFWLSSFLLLSWPLRVLIESQTAYVHYHVTKLFGTNYAAQQLVHTQQQQQNRHHHHQQQQQQQQHHQVHVLTPSSTVTSADMEWSIRNNFTIVPSYSEALLMDGEVVTVTVGGAPSEEPVVERELGDVDTAALCATTTGTSLPRGARRHSSMGHRTYMHSWGLVGDTMTFPRGLTLPVSLTRLSLHNGHVLYRPLPIWEVSSGPAPTHSHRRVASAKSSSSSSSSSSCAQSRRWHHFQRHLCDGDGPPDYDVAIQVSRPLGGNTMRRSLTDRDLPLVANGGHCVRLAEGETAL